jgi:SPP1 family predicted phage head-tail adaptor
MCERLVIQTNTPTTDSHGASIPSWSTLDTVFGERIPLRASETQQAARVGSQVDYRFRVRARTDITAALRISWTPLYPSGASAQILEIAGIVPDPKDRAYMFIECGSHDGGQV